MTTSLLKAVRRRTVSPHRGRRIVASLEPGDLIGLRMERSKRMEYVPIAAVYDFAVKARVLAEKSAKRKSKKERKT